MANYRHNGHTVSSLTCHLVWATKYRYEVLQGDIQKRCRELLIQICNSEDVHILKGVVSKDHVHMHIEYSPHQSISLLVKKLKGRTSHFESISIFSALTSISPVSMSALIIS